MKLVSSEHMQAAGRDAALHHVTQIMDGTEFREWVLVFGKEAETVKDIKVVSGQPLANNGPAAYELVADPTTATEAADPICLVQAVIPTGKRHFPVQGLVGAAKREEYLPEFQQLAASFRLVR